MDPLVLLKLAKQDRKTINVVKERGWHCLGWRSNFLQIN